jgi:hypothetical protein
MLDETHKSLHELRIQLTATEQGVVEIWRQFDSNVLPLFDNRGLSRSQVTLMREQVIEARFKISEVMQLIAPVRELLDLVVPFELDRGPARPGD